MTKVPVLRFAPSPTGYLHVGGARTALFNWLYAKKMGGKFILRIEDTDTKRSTPEAVEAIFEGMKWLGLTWDEGPDKPNGDTKYFQTERLDTYNKFTQQLLDQGDAYKCYRTSEELAILREQTKAKGYQREWSGTHEERAQWDTEGRPFVVRFKSPQFGTIEFEDILHGALSFNITDSVDDFVIMKNDGIPTYNYAVVIDDATMGVTHVLRGDDHLSNTPKQIAVYQALGFEIPKFGHMPMILGGDKQKLSKRHGATSVTLYRDNGYLREALLNQLVRLGWSCGDKELFTEAEMIELFNLENLNKSAAVFDFKKLDHLNAHFIRETKSDDLYMEMMNRLTAKDGRPRGGLAGNEFEVIDLLKPRVKNLNDLLGGLNMFMAQAINIAPELHSQYVVPNAEILQKLILDLSNLDTWTVDELNNKLTHIAQANNVKMGVFSQAVRVAVTGSTASPGLAETLHLIGQQAVVKRLQQACVAGIVATAY